jgi:hypothetical protein
VRGLLRPVILTLALALSPATARAEWQVKPFGGVTFGGSTTFVNLDDAAGTPKFNVGVSGLWLGNVLGLEGDVATTSGFFSGEQKLILKSHVATLTGNVVVALPKRIAQYGLRPYAVGGLGMMHVGLYDNFAALSFSDALPAWDLGGGATGFLTDFVGLNWDIRMFKSFGGQQGVSGISFGPEQLSFWRATMGLSVRL